MVRLAAETVLFLPVTDHGGVCLCGGGSRDQPPALAKRAEGAPLQRGI